MTNQLKSMDFRILNFIYNKLSCNFLNYIMPKITFLGNGGFIWLVTATIMLCFKKYQKQAFVLLVGLLAGVVIGNLILKNLISRKRPCWINNNVSLIVSTPKDYSFPSGHTMSSFIAMTILMQTNQLLGFLSFIFAILISFSRLYLYLHFPSDILGGVVIGILLGNATWYIFSFIMNYI